MAVGVFDELNQNSAATADRLVGIDAASPLETADFTGPLAPLVEFAIDVAAGAEVELMPANPAVLKVYVLHEGTAGRLRLGLGQTAQAGHGLYLDPGDAFDEYLNCAIRVLNTGTAAVHVIGLGFGA